MAEWFQWFEVMVYTSLVWISSLRSLTTAAGFMFSLKVFI